VLIALYTNSNGNNNTATGEGALYGNKTGSGDTANGQDALYSNTDGSSNTATGFGALFSNTSGFSNTANGWSALLFNTTGSNNIALGVGAGGNLTTGSNNIDIGNTGVAGESARIRVGTKGTHKNTYVAGIYGVTVPRGLGVIVDSSGHLGTSTSSVRFKDEIKPMDKASEAILSLEPVTFRYKHELDPDGIPQFGLLAEQVAKVNRDLVAFDDEGKAYTVRYEAVNAMLLNEFLKEHRRVEEQQAMIVRVNSTVAKQDTTITDLKSTLALQQKQFQATLAQQQKEIEALTAGLKEQAAQVQKVSDQLAAANPSFGGLEANRLALPLVVGNQ
jgi:trimeric autotransporter adhesin